MKDLIPTIIKILDVIPFKGYRTLFFSAALVIVVGLGATGVVSKDNVDTIAYSIVPLITYFAGSHKEE